MGEEFPCDENKSKREGNRKLRGVKALRKQTGDGLRETGEKGQSALKIHQTRYPTREREAKGGDEGPTMGNNTEERKGKIKGRHTQKQNYTQEIQRERLRGKERIT